MFSATLIQTYWPTGPDPIKVTPILLEAASVDEIYRQAFKKYFNPSSRSFTVNYAFEDPVHEKGYLKWESNVSNYAFNGGNMD